MPSIVSDKEHWIVAHRQPTSQQTPNKVGVDVEAKFGNYWHEHAAFGRSTAGIRRSGHYFHQSFPFFPPRFPPTRPFLIEGVLGSKILFS